MSSGGQQPVTQQTQQTKDPWGPAQPHLTDTMGFARSYFGGNVGYQPYTGQTQADLHPFFNMGSGDLYNTLSQDAATGGTAGVSSRTAWFTYPTGSVSRRRSTTSNPSPSGRRTSTWYWPALFGRSQGPWWSTTVVESRPVR